MVVNNDFGFTQAMLKVILKGKLTAKGVGIFPANQINVVMN
jgi:hypothetical protein